jgi:hypothetical protein
VVVIELGISSSQQRRHDKWKTSQGRDMTNGQMLHLTSVEGDSN